MRGATVGRRTAFYATLGFAEDTNSTAAAESVPTSPVTQSTPGKDGKSPNGKGNQLDKIPAEVKVSWLPLSRPLPTRIRPEFPVDMFDHIFDAM